jgi:siroheme synthase
MLGEHGWRPDTPAAILGAASTAEAFTWTGSLSGLGAASLPDPWPAAYGTVIVGDVVGLSRQVAASFVDGAHAVSGLALAGAMAR